MRKTNKNTAKKKAKKEEKKENVLSIVSDQKSLYTKIVDKYEEGLDRGEQFCSVKDLISVCTAYLELFQKEEAEKNARSEEIPDHLLKDPEIQKQLEVLNELVISKQSPIIRNEVV